MGRLLVYVFFDLDSNRFIGKGLSLENTFTGLSLRGRRLDLVLHCCLMFLMLLLPRTTSHTNLSPYQDVNRQ